MRLSARMIATAACVVFLMSAFKLRGEESAKTSADEKAADYDQKNPGMPISFQLEKIKQFSNPVWRVIWGESAGTSSFSIYVDASMGNFLEKMH